MNIIREPSIEIARSIPGFPGYFISRKGNIYSTKNNSLKLRPTYLSNAGYRVITLSLNGQIESKSIHVLLAITYIPNPKKYKVVMHLDNNRLNNSIDNLKWGTQGDNINQSIKDHKLFGDNHFVSIKLEVCKNILKDRNYGLSRGQLAKKYNTSKSSIDRILKRKTYNSIKANERT